mgnify:FL=1
MIILKIRGGIGNQMFQYAFGKSISRKFRTDVILDLEALFNQAPRVGAMPRTYGLNIFSIRPKFTLLSKVGLFINRTDSKLVKFLFKTKEVLKTMIKPIYERKVITEEEFHSDANLTQKTIEGSCFSGYWQNEKYFKDIKDEIKKDFSFKNSVSEKFVPILKAIKDSASVCIHVRRGDNVLNPISSKVFGYLEIDYYKKAFSMMEGLVPNAKFFIFSDDIAWCIENFKFIPDVVFVSDKNNEADPSDDMQLMSNCSHFIISNSTLSWWVAYLGKNPAKIVITPKNWFKDKAMNKNYKDNLLLPEWKPI